MTHFYEKQSAGANGLGVTDKPWQGSFAPSGSWQGGMPNMLHAQQQQPNMFQQQLTPSSKLADVDGIHQAMQKFHKTGNAMDNNESKFRNLISKHAAQDNSVDSRSAAGEGKGVTYKTNDDDHATGTAAWESIGQYMKSANEIFFVPAGVKLADTANVDEYIAGGMPARAAIKKAYPNWSGDQIDAFMSTYNKRAGDAKHDCDKEHPGISHDEWEEKDAADALYAFMDSIPQEKRASLAEFVKTSSTSGEAFELWMDKEGLDKRMVWEKLAWIGPALAAGRAAIPWIGRGLAKIPSMFRAGKAMGTATAAAKGSGKVMQAVKGMGTGLTAGGKQLSRTVLGRAPGTAGKFARGTGIRGWAGRNPVAAVTTLPMIPGMVAGGYNAMTGGGSQQPGVFPQGGGSQPRGMAGGQQPGQGGPIGYGTGGGQGVAPWQQHQQQPGHTPGVAPMMKDKIGMDKQAFGAGEIAQLAMIMGGGLLGGAGGRKIGKNPLFRSLFAPNRGKVRVAKRPVGPAKGRSPDAQKAYKADRKRARTEAAAMQKHMKRVDPIVRHGSTAVGSVAGASAGALGGDSFKEGCDKLGLTPYQLSFAIRVHEANLSPQQIKVGIDKAGEYMGEEYVEELREGMDKIASAGLLAKAMRYAPKMWTGAKNLFKAAPKAGKPGANASYVGNVVNKFFQGRKGTKLLETGAKATKGHDFSKALGLLGGQGKGFKSGLGGAARMGIGAMTGGEMVGQDAPWYVKAPAMLAGGAFGRAMPNMGIGARAAGNRAMWGGAGGFALDEGAGMAGIDTGGRFGQMGALGGFASPLLKGQKIPAALTKGKYNPLTKLTGKKLPNLGFTASGARTKGLGKDLATWADKNKGWMGTKGLGASTMAPMAAGTLGGVAQGVGGAVNDYVDDKVEGARSKTEQNIMSNPQVQKALNMAEQGGGFMDSLSGIGNVIDPLLKMIGMDPSQMNPLMKILLMAGGGLGLGGLLSGSKGAGIGGGAMMAIPLIAQMMKKQQPGGGRLGPGSGFQPHPDWTAGQVDPNRAALGLDGGLGEQTELEKATYK